MSKVMDVWNHCLAIRKEPKHFTEFDYYRNCLGFQAFWNDDDHAMVCVYKGNNQVFKKEFVVIITFRGTKDASAWRSNFDLYPLRDKVFKDGEWGRGTIHDGFYTGWSNLKQEIMEYIKPYLHDDKYEIICTGHSRGGALAILCGRHLVKNEKVNAITVYAFGTPRQGNREYVAQMGTIMDQGLYIMRIVNGWDLVTSLPPDELGFAHCGPAIELPQPFWHKLKFMKILDHRYESYTKNIKKYLGMIQM